LSAFSRINRNKFLPAVNKQWQQQLLDSMPTQIKYEFIDSGISSSGDLGYVYGATMINGKQDGYLRIWRKETEGWKIALEVLRY
jgi:ketosteroid isomerase-like protein